MRAGKSLEFDPYNWLSKDHRSVQLNTGRGNFVWGAGQRRCVGQHLAFAELVTELACIAHAVKSIHIDPAEAEREFAPFSYPSGLPLRLKPCAPVATAAPADAVDAGGSRV